MSISTVAAPVTIPNCAELPPRSARLFAVAALSVAVVAWALALWAPLGFSIIAVLLFAGPHNWMEARYFLERMPARWGKLWAFFLLGLVGVTVLAASYMALPWVAHRWQWSASTWLFATALWNSALALWILSLAHLRSRQNPRRDWLWIWPVGLTLIALNWLWPREWGLALVYLHPLVAFAFLDQEIRRVRRQWRSTYHVCLVAIAGLGVVLCWSLADTPSLPGDDALSLRIAWHAGAQVLQGISSHLLVALHVFLETLHYGIWLLAIPAIALRSEPWRLQTSPLARRSPHWRHALAAVLALGLLAVVGFWAGFLADYPQTRDVYFTVAMIHVLAEAPLLLRTL